MSIDRSSLKQTISRAERSVGKLLTGEMDGKRFAEHVKVAHGTIKRWVHEGMPVIRDGCHIWIRPEEAKAWIAERFRGRKTVAFDRHSFIYFAQAEDGTIKIGWSADVIRRIAELRKYRRQAVHLLACFPGDKPDELRLHDRFQALRWAGDPEGEWYEDDGTILAYVGKILEAPKVA